MTEYSEFSRRTLIVCELCQRCFSPEGFQDHLNSHTKEEVEALKKLAELEAKDPEEHEKLVWELLRQEYFYNQEKRKENEKKERRES